MTLEGRLNHINSCVFELDMDGSNSHHDVSPPFDLLAITNTTWQRKKAAGFHRPLKCLAFPTVDNLRNFFFMSGLLDSAGISSHLFPQYQWLRGPTSPVLALVPLP